MSGEPFGRQHPRPPQGWADTFILTTVGLALAFCTLTLALLWAGVLER